MKSTDSLRVKTLKRSKSKKKRSPQKSTSKASKKKRKTENSSGSPRWCPEHSELKTQVEEELRKELKKAMQLKPSDVDPPKFESDIQWLMSTREAFSFCLKLNRNSEAIQDICKKLAEFWKDSQSRRDDLRKCVCARMYELGRDAFKDKLTWVPSKVKVKIPPGSFLMPNIGMKFGPSEAPSTPNGLHVSGFCPDMMGQPGPIEATGSIRVGDVITEFSPGSGSGKSAVQAAINMFVNMSVLRLMNAGGMMMMMPGLMAMPPAVETVTLCVHRLDNASKAKVENIRSNALAPERVEKVLESKLVDQYARATHAPKGEDALWLLNKASVINTILAPLERKEELRSLFRKKNVALEGTADIEASSSSSVEAAVLNPAWTASRPKMYDLFTVSELVNKFIQDGEVGRGRNKTSLKTASQIVNVVVAELKKAGLISK